MEARYRYPGQYLTPLATHISSTTTVTDMDTLAHRVHHSMLIDALAHFEYPKASQQHARLVQSLQPLTHLTSLI